MTRLLVITPARNEAAHLQRVVAGMARQRRRPDRWVIVDDGSSDATVAVAERLARGEPWIEVLRAAPHPASGTDRLADAAEARAFLWALSEVGGAWDFVAKLDADIVLSPQHYERLLEEMAGDPALGIAGCYLEQRAGGRRRIQQMPRYHVNGALKLYRRACWEAIGGMTPSLGWDTLDEVRARQLGWRTESLFDLRAEHLRPSGSAGGQLRGRARHGACAWIANYPPELVVLRALRLTAAAPLPLSGIAYLWGWATAAARRRGRPNDPELLRFARSEQRARLRQAVRRRRQA